MESVARNRSSVAGEGIPWLIVALLITLIVFRLAGPAWSLLPAAGLLALFMLFRDPARAVPPLPLAVLAPVDGRILEAEETAAGQVTGRWLRVRIRCNPLGAYTVRAPIEGTVGSMQGRLGEGETANGLWLRSEEDDEVALLFPRARIGPQPRAFVRYGERLGQGQRFAYLRLAPVAELYLPASARLLVEPGTRVRAGVTALAELRRD